MAFLDVFTLFGPRFQAHAHRYRLLKLSLLTIALRVLPATLMPVISKYLAHHLEGQL